MLSVSSRALYISYLESFFFHLVSRPSRPSALQSHCIAFRIDVLRFLSLLHHIIVPNYYLQSSSAAGSRQAFGCFVACLSTPVPPTYIQTVTASCTSLTCHSRDPRNDRHLPLPHRHTPGIPTHLVPNRHRISIPAALCRVLRLCSL